jgi:hypothetical protein
MAFPTIYLATHLRTRERTRLHRRILPIISSATAPHALESCLMLVMTRSHSSSRRWVPDHSGLWRGAGESVGVAAVDPEPIELLVSPGNTATAFIVVIPELEIGPVYCLAVPTTQPE